MALSPIETLESLGLGSQFAPRLPSRRIVPQVAFDGRGAVTPELSIILLDWSCRESLHALDYLNRQTADRDSYEILWLENYSRYHPELAARLAQAQSLGRHPDVDLQIVLGMPIDTCYHKHLLYNLGIALARGKWVCLCDSDAIFRPTFVASTLKTLRETPGIVLHLDQARNDRVDFHPFDYPSLDDIVGPGCANWVDGKPRGLREPRDPLHDRNYGACFCAPRSALIEIGGADMSRDYLGYVCGPYEMTFRLKNAGWREVWGSDEWLYHVWHPGQAGERNHVGPHDGKHMSRTALSIPRSGRVRPLLEHPAIAELRKSDPLAESAPTELEFVSARWLEEWRYDRLPTREKEFVVGGRRVHSQEITDDGELAEAPRDSSKRRKGDRLGRWSRVRVLPAFLRLLWRQLQVKRGAAAMNPTVVGPRPKARALFEARAFVKIRSLLAFIRRMARHNRFLFHRAWINLRYLRDRGDREIAVYGGPDATLIVLAMARIMGIRARQIVRFEATEKCPRKLADWRGAVVLAAFVNSRPRVVQLASWGIERDRVVVLE